MNRLFVSISIFIIFTSLQPGSGKSVKKQEGQVLELQQYLAKTAQNDPYFKELLIEQLYTKYSKDSQLPASDIVLDATAQYILDITDDDTDNSGTEGEISVSKLFPMTATTVSANYSADRSIYSSVDQPTATLNFEISQAIARNAFGRSTRKLNRKIELENKLVRYQVVEAYEDYFASLIVRYINWFTYYQQILVTKRTISYNKNLLSLIRRKRRYGVAYTQEVDKIKLELIEAQEDLISQELEYKILSNNINASINNTDTTWVPESPGLIVNKEFDSRLETLINNGNKVNRTLIMYSLMEESGILAREIAEDNLLPSASLFAGYSQSGTDYTIKDPRHYLYFGVTTSLNFGRQKEKASYEISKIDLQKTLFEKQSTILTLKTDIKNLHAQINKQIQLIKLAGDKKQLANRIMNAEYKNYFIGKASLNDLVTAKDQYQQASYSVIYQELILQQLIVEWKRITDTLVKNKDIEKSITGK